MKLLAVLLDTTRPLTATEIAERIGGYPEAKTAFRRAFERDKDDLRSMGVNILVESVSVSDPPINGYRVLADEYAGTDPGLEPDELAALHLAAALIQVDDPDDAAFWKLGGVAHDHQQPPIATVPSKEASTFYEAIVERRPARFTYSELEREIHPARLSFQKGNWYVSGYDTTRSAQRTFRLDRIVGAVELGKPDSFEMKLGRGPETTRTWELGDEEPQRTLVAIDASEAVWARRHLSDEEIIESREDGSVVVELSVRNFDAFVDWLFGFLDHAVVLEPAETRDRVVFWLQSIVEAER